MHLIEEIQTTQNIGLEEAARIIALSKVIGAMLSSSLTATIPISSLPLAKEVHWWSDWVKMEYFIGSDATPIIIDYTKKVIYLQDEIAIIKTVTSKSRISK